jgi:hypothetical protein
MKVTTLLATVAAVFVFSQSAQAREHHFRHGARHEARRHESVRHHWARRDRPDQPDSFSFLGQSGFGESAWQPYSSSERTARRGGLGGRPAAWCGWEMRQLVSADPGPEYNLARNWARWGRSGPAGVGAIVVWPHHVGKIVGQEGGEWVIKSGNDGHALRTRPRSIAGAIAIRWG